MTRNLIANSGIQLVSIPLEINMQDNFKMYFHEWYDTQDKQLKLEIAHYFSQDDVWVKKHNLSFLGYAATGVVTANWENVESDFKGEGYTPIKIETDRAEDSGCFPETLSGINWEKFENTWFPMPFFQLNGRRSEFGPTNWCRFKLIPVEKNGKIRSYSLLLAFDTKSIFEKETFEDEDLNETPVFTSKFENDKNFALCNDEYKLIAYCSEAMNCGWVDKYVLKKFHNIDSIEEYKGAKPKLKYLAQYIFILRYIQQLDLLPQITLYSNQNVAVSKVDLVVDIGNSRTCAVLFDNGDFDKMSPLELQDFTSPVSAGKLNKYLDSFDMRLAFREADFGGKLGIENSRQFVFPSMIRLGKEANQLIHKATNMNTGAEKNSTFSSPKRFLWDTKAQSKEWEFVQLEGESARPIYIQGISEQLNTDGSLNTAGDGGVLMHYSRRALMTFAFLEILGQANMQINSYEQRRHWGNESMPRQIGRIIITCPTAMSRVEQISLRKCAEDAAIMLDRFFKNKYNEKVDEANARNNILVIPSPKNLGQNEHGAEWIYDEATAAQFVFLYAEINQRYMNNTKKYFDLYGKVRGDLDDYNNKSLTIGSVDIGAGTTDVMIASYKYDDAAQCKLIPVPLFWESFYKAGDDLMKVLVQQLVIEGNLSPIEKKLKSLGKNPIELLQPFFGTDVGVSFRNKQLRSDFNLQVSVPIVSRFLELLKEDKCESQILSFGDIFSSNLPTQSVLNYFKQNFGFEFESLQWQYERKTVSAIIEKVFDSLVGKISALLSYYGCDIVLLSGRPTSLKPLTDLFLKHYAITPNRLKTMNDYRVGRWYPQDMRYPFVDANGKFINPKSIITTGALIGFKAENGGIKGFSLNLKELKEKLLPTTHYFGKLNQQLVYTQTIISHEINQTTVEIDSLPFRIGVRQLDIPAYPSRPFYILDFNDFKIEDRVRGRLDEESDLQAIQKGIELEKDKILKQLPLKISIERDISMDVELLKLREVLGQDGNALPLQFFVLQVQSMSELDKFWLDSGIFSLNIHN